LIIGVPAPIAGSAKGVGHTQGGAIVAWVYVNAGTTELLDHPGFRGQVRGHALDGKTE
jgi:hypothetical protein